MVKAMKWLAIALMAMPVLAKADKYSDNNPEGELIVKVIDHSGSDTNVRQSPGGKVVCTLPAGQEYRFVMKDGVKAENGWIRIAGDAVYRYEEEPDVEYTTDKARVTLTGSTTGYWIHSSVVELDALYDPEQPVLLLCEPKKEAAVAYGHSRGGEYRPLQRQGDWVLLTTYDGKNRGWTKIDNVVTGDLFNGTDCCCGEPNEYAIKWANQLNWPFYVNGSLNIETVVDALCLVNPRYGWSVDPIIDRKNGYFRYHEEGAGSITYEVAYWKRTDGRILVICSYRMGEEYWYEREKDDPLQEEQNEWYHYKMHTVKDGPDGALFHTEAGCMAWLYNAQTHMLEPLKEPPFNNLPSTQYFRRYSLPQQGTTIKVSEFDPYDYEVEAPEYSLKFNGQTFDYQK